MTRKYFHSADDAAMFKEGVDYVNDSALTVSEPIRNEAIEEDGMENAWFLIITDADDTEVEFCDECNGTRYPEEVHEPHCSLHADNQIQTLTGD